MNSNFVQFNQRTLSGKRPAYEQRSSSGKPMFLQKAMKNQQAHMQMNNFNNINALSSGITSGQQTGQFGAGSILNSNKREQSPTPQSLNYNTVNVASYNPH